MILWETAALLLGLFYQAIPSFLLLFLVSHDVPKYNTNLMISKSDVLVLRHN